MPSVPYQIRGASGHQLAARLDTPDQAPSAWAMFVHCFTCSKDSKAAVYVSRALVIRGFGVLRFDFTGLGASEGRFEETDFSSNVADVQHAAQWLRDGFGAPALLIGHSLGGAAVLAAAADIPDARALVTIGAPFDPAHVARHFRDALERIAEEGRATVSLGRRPLTITQAFVDDLKSQEPSARIAALGRPLLILHAPDDRVVPVSEAGAIFAAARHPRSFVALDGADHLLTREPDAEYAASLIAAWAEPYAPSRSTRLGPPSPPPHHPAHE